uniref:Linker for activation of T-cells family member 2 n=1 Tax=Sciurus vulgaris TaxID=55149 RepID=A0A8D2DR63_SCIVU
MRVQCLREVWWDGAPPPGARRCRPTWSPRLKLGGFFPVSIHHGRTLGGPRLESLLGAGPRAPHQPGCPPEPQPRPAVSCCPPRGHPGRLPPTAAPLQASPAHLAVTSGDREGAGWRPGSQLAQCPGATGQCWQQGGRGAGPDRPRAVPSLADDDDDANSYENVLICKPRTPGSGEAAHPRGRARPACGEPCCRAATSPPLVPQAPLRGEETEDYQNSASIHQWRESRRAEGTWPRSRGPGAARAVRSPDEDAGEPDYVNGDLMAAREA